MINWNNLKKKKQQKNKAGWRLRCQIGVKCQAAGFKMQFYSSNASPSCPPLVSQKRWRQAVVHCGNYFAENN